MLLATTCYHLLPPTTFFLLAAAFFFLLGPYYFLLFICSMPLATHLNLTLKVCLSTALILDMIITSTKLVPRTVTLQLITRSQGYLAQHQNSTFKIVSSAKPTSKGWVLTPPHSTEITIMQIEINK